MTAKREAILKAAADTLARNPSVSFTELAPAIGIARATLYRYFEKREDLIRALAIYVLHEFDKQMEQIKRHDKRPMETLHALLEALIPIGDQYHFLSREWDVLDDPEIAGIYSRQTGEFTSLIQAAKDEGSLARDIPNHWILNVMEALIYTAWASVESGDLARNDAASLVYRTLKKGLGE